MSNLKIIVWLVCWYLEVMEDEKPIPNAVPLAFVAKEESGKGKKSKVIADDLNSDATNDEFTSKEKVLMDSYPKKFFKKYFSRFKNKNTTRSDDGGNRFEGSNSKKNKGDGFKNYQCADKKKEMKLVGDFGYD